MTTMHKLLSVALAIVCLAGASLAEFLISPGNSAPRRPVPGQTAGSALDPAPRHLTTEFENNKVQVLRIRIEPHEKTPMHEAPPRVVVYLTDDHSVLVFPDGTTRKQSHDAG